MIWPNRDPLEEPGFEVLHLVSQPLFARKLRLGINDPEMQFLLGMAILSGSVNVDAYLRNSHTPYPGNAISVSTFFNLLKISQDSYAPNWPAELLEYPNLFDFVGDDPLDGIDPFGLWHWYNPISWPVVEAIWNAIQYIAPAGEGEGAGAIECAPGMYHIWTNEPPKYKFGDDPDNAPIPPTAG
ncbi:MAG TPA: hypothetical protein VFC44_03215 [Candidatus Saccharimonadales bacterium]|nr:hypothetical protein [Candidatus Saccharimonadales bacterium]